MLNSIRRNTGGLVAKLFIGLLAASFAVWGVADIFSGYRSQAVITVGDTEVSAQEYQSLFQQEMQRAGQQMGRTLSLDEARALGIEGRVLGRLLTQATLDNDARARKLGINTDQVAQSIASDPMFQDNFGRFNKSYFDQLLRSNGLSEDAYVAAERQAQLRQQLASAVTTGSVAPQTLVEALYRFQEERRTIDFVVLGPSAIGAVDDPTDEELEAWFEDHRREFRQPEFRKVALIDATAGKLTGNVEVTDEDIEAAYEQRKDEFTTPERRTVQQIVFPGEEEARAAAERLNEGADFMEIARERGLSENDISLGTVSRSAIGDPVVADAAFALEEGEISDPVSGSLSTVILRVSDIEEGATRPLDEVREEIRADLARRQAQDAAYDIYDKVEDLRASGATFREIADELALEFREIEAVDARGRDMQGQEIDLPASDALLNTIADNEPGYDLDAVQGDGGFVWVEIVDVTPERQQELDEVREEAIAAWKREETSRQLADRANELLEQARADGHLDGVTGELGVPLTTTPPLSRNADSDSLSRAAIQAAFSTPVGGFSSSAHADGESRVLMRVADSEVPSFDADSEEAQRLAREVRDSMSSGQMSQYVTARQDRFGVNINQQTLQSLLGGGS